MPAVNEYPNPYSITVGVTGPLWTTFFHDGPEPQVTVGPKYEDGGRDRLVTSPLDINGVVIGVHKWEIDYYVTQAEQAVLDAHHLSAAGQGYGFNFYDHRAGVLWTNVHYESYKRDKGKKRTRGRRKVVLVWEPS
jgi:hypothetical protein